MYYNGLLAKNKTKVSWNTILFPASKTASLRSLKNCSCPRFCFCTHTQYWSSIRLFPTKLFKRIVFNSLIQNPDGYTEIILIFIGHPLKYRYVQGGSSAISYPSGSDLLYSNGTSTKNALPLVSGLIKLFGKRPPALVSNASGMLLK